MSTLGRAITELAREVAGQQVIGWAGMVVVYTSQGQSALWIEASPTGLGDLLRAEHREMCRVVDEALNGDELDEQRA